MGTDINKELEAQLLASKMRAEALRKKTKVLRELGDYLMDGLLVVLFFFCLYSSFKDRIEILYTAIVFLFLISRTINSQTRKIEEQLEDLTKLIEKKISEEK